MKQVSLILHPLVLYMYGYVQWRSQGGAHWGTCPTNFILCPTKFFLVNLQITTITLFKQIVNYIPNIPKPSMILHQSIWSLNGSLLDHKFR